MEEGDPEMELTSAKVPLYLVLAVFKDTSFSKSIKAVKYLQVVYAGRPYISIWGEDKSPGTRYRQAH